MKLTSQPIPHSTNLGCPRCGSTSIHACPGRPIVWTPEEVEKLSRVMQDIFKDSRPSGHARKITDIYLDLDGVFVDFYGNAERLIGHPYKAVSGAHAWGILDKVPALFRELPALPDAAQLWQGVRDVADLHQLTVRVLSALPQLTRELVSAPQDKEHWVRTHLSPMPEVNLVHGGKNKAVFAAPHAVLIDDLPRNIDAWRAAGGIGILHCSAEQTLAELVSLFNES